MNFNIDLQPSEDADCRSVHLVYPNQPLADAFHGAIAPLSSRQMKGKVTIQSYVYQEDSNQCLQYLSELRDSDHAILVGSDARVLKLAFDHLQLIGKSFAMTSLTPGFGQGDDVETLIQLAKPGMTDCALVGIQEHLLHGEPRELDFPIFSLHLKDLLDDLSSVEPIVRRSNLYHIDTEILIGQKNGAVGLTTQQNAQIAHYAGRGVEAKFLALTAVSPTDKWTLKAVATIIWYYLYGLTLRPKQPDENLQEYLIDGTVDKLMLSFHRNSGSQHWWCTAATSKSRPKTLMPCSYRDYTMASAQQELSPWLDFILARG